MLVTTTVSLNTDEVQQKLNIGITAEEIVEQANIIISF
jgi:hypothetical protein